jgi:hypothetical protein
MNVPARCVGVELAKVVDLSLACHVRKNASAEALSSLSKDAFQKASVAGKHLLFQVF